MCIIFVTAGFALGWANINATQMREIASEPENRHYFYVPALSDMARYVEKVASAITCGRQSGKGPFVMYYM